MGTDTTASLYGDLFNWRESVKNTHLKRLDGTSALSSSGQIEAELMKDCWDARNIPGLRYAPHRNNHYVSFSGVPETFRPIVKDYVKFQLAAGRATKTLAECAYYLGKFFTFFLRRYPRISTIHALTQQDIDAFIIHLKSSVNNRGKPTSNQQISRSLQSLEGFLCYLERSEHPMRPHKPTVCIIWPHHYPRKDSNPSAQVKYIPQFVLKQLDAHLQHLSPTYIPVVILLRASGWRISDVLYLKWDTCLEQDCGKYCLVGDIQKTKLLGHKIPITAEVAAVILAQVEWVKQHYTPEENPQRWLFPASKKYPTSQRFLSGDPLKVSGVEWALEQLSEKYQIQDESGGRCHFRLHAFRHSKAVELLNNGMSLVMVHQWMAHASPEMTLIYAKILDETMRTQWEKTVQQGIVQFNDGKPEFVPGKKLLPMPGANTFDPERVREHRQNVKMALGSCLKTAKIVCKFVELPCFHCPAYVLTPDDLPALEAYERQILKRIEIGKQAGNVHWTLVNQKNLDERVRPAIVLLKQGHIVAKTDKQEREYTDEEWEQRQHDQQEQTHE
jgi:integrase